MGELPMTAIQVGQSAKMTKVISSEDIQGFAAASGDTNPVHLDDAYASQTVFKKRIAHGMLVGGMISAVLGVQLPGPGTIYLGQTLQFRAPVYVGDEVTATVEVINIRADKPIITLRTVCVNQNQQIVLEGEAVVRVPDTSIVMPA
jgi:acyl dehydratase